MLLLAVMTSQTLHPAALRGEEDRVADAIRQRIENGVKQDGTVAGVTLFNPQGLAAYYGENSHQASWGDRRNREDLVKALEDSRLHGLLPEDYHLATIRRLLAALEDDDEDPALLADLDLVLTDAISLYAYHLTHGKVDQSAIRKDWDVPVNPPLENPRKLLRETLKKHRVEKVLAELAPRHFMYRYLQDGLARYREIAADGGWPRVPEGEVLKLGVTSDAVALLREYLTIVGDHPERSRHDDERIFDEDLEAALKRFQARHNLTQDGVGGAGTLAQINVPVEERIETIRLNMERMRWLMHELAPDFLVVNIAGFTAYRMTDGRNVYQSPVIVGKTYHQSPIFRGRMTHIVLNPTWTVPKSIASREMLPRLQKDPDYLAEKNMIIMDESGQQQDPHEIDFGDYSADDFPFVIRQEPGPGNALGEVKFMFPNDYAVYLHDTPARDLFSQEERAFSHGCIRLQETWELLMSLVDDPEWDLERIEEVLATQETTTIDLEHPIDILILYWTAGADVEKRLYFYRDVYERDPAVLQALNQPLSRHE